MFGRKTKNPLEELAKTVKYKDSKAAKDMATKILDGIEAKKHKADEKKGKGHAVAVGASVLAVAAVGFCFVDGVLHTYKNHFGEIGFVIDEISGNSSTSPTPAPKPTPTKSEGELSPILRFGEPSGEVVAFQVTPQAITQVGGLAVIGAEADAAPQLELLAA